MADPADITLRPLQSRDEYESCVRLQRDTWGPDFLDVVPAAILMVCQRVGGVAAGAFDSSRRLLGFVFGINGVRNGELAHWSDMLAVRPEVRRKGLGKRLKVYQRELLLRHGIRVAYWSFDPLVAANAHLNLNGLGAAPVEYVVDMYGDTGSTLHSGLDTDRLVVEWRLTDPQVERALAGHAEPAAPFPFAHDVPIVNPDTSTASLVIAEALPPLPWVRVAVPQNIDEVKAAAPDDARLWQLATRRAFQWYFGHGYRVAGFQDTTDGRHASYLLARDAPAKGM